MKTKTTYFSDFFLKGGDGNFYYNFDIVEGFVKDEKGLDIEKQKIQECLDREGYNHQATI